jgi:hypothetical protein
MVYVASQCQDGRQLLFADWSDAVPITEPSAAARFSDNVLDC